MKPPCPECHSYDLNVLDTRKRSESLYKRRYQCVACHKKFSAYAEYTQNETEKGIVYTTTFTYTKYKAHRTE